MVENWEKKVRRRKFREENSEKKIRRRKESLRCFCRSQSQDALDGHPCCVIGSQVYRLELLEDFAGRAIEREEDVPGDIVEEELRDKAPGAAGLRIKNRYILLHHLSYMWLFQHQNKGTPPCTSCNAQVYNLGIPVLAWI